MKGGPRAPDHGRVAGECLREAGRHRPRDKGEGPVEQRAHDDVHPDELRRLLAPALAYRAREQALTV